MLFSPPNRILSYSIVFLASILLIKWCVQTPTIKVGNSEHLLEPPAMTHKLLLTGTTGVAGLQIYLTAINDPAISNITVLSRRPLPDYVPASDKVQVIVIEDFLNYSPELVSRLVEHDACIWALGGSARGHTDESYAVFTVEYVKVFIEALQRGGVASRPDNAPFRFIFVSGEGADPEEKAYVRFARIKGRAEKYLLELPPSSGVRASTVRPGWFHPTKEYVHQRSATMRFIHPFLSPVVKTVWPAMYTPIEAIGTVTVELAKGRWSDEQVIKSTRITELQAKA